MFSTFFMCKHKYTCLLCKQYEQNLEVDWFWFLLYALKLEIFIFKNFHVRKKNNSWSSASSKLVDQNFRASYVRKDVF